MHDAAAANGGKFSVRFAAFFVFPGRVRNRAVKNKSRTRPERKVRFLHFSAPQNRDIVRSELVARRKSKQQGGRRPMKRGKFLKFVSRNGELFIFSLPAIIYIFIMSYVPMFGVIIAFKNYVYDKGILGSEWVGFKNFKFLFESENAYRITRNTVLYNLGYMFMTTVFSLAVAILLHEVAKKWLKIYQTAMILPFFLSWVVVSYITMAFLDHQNGFLNGWLEESGSIGFNGTSKPAYGPTFSMPSIYGRPSASRRSCISPASSASTLNCTKRPRSTAPNDGR